MRTLASRSTICFWANILANLRDLPAETLTAVSKALLVPGLGRTGRDEVLKVAERVAAEVRHGAMLQAALARGLVGNA